MWGQKIVEENSTKEFHCYWEQSNGERAVIRDVGSKEGLIKTGVIIAHWHATAVEERAILGGISINR